MATSWNVLILNQIILVIKPTRCTNLSNLFLALNSTCFGQFLCAPSGVFHCTHSKTVWYIPLWRVQWKTPDDAQRNCPKHVDFNSKNKFEKLVHLVGFVIRICHDERSPERHKPIKFRIFICGAFTMKIAFKYTHYIRYICRSVLNPLDIFSCSVTEISSL